MIRISPAVRISIGLMFITLSVFLFAQLIGLIPDQSRIAMDERKSNAQSLAVQYTMALQYSGHRATKKTIDAIVSMNPGVLSIGVRNSGGTYVGQTRDHHKNWTPLEGELSTFEQWQVPLYRNKLRWGTMEISFAPEQGFSLLGYRISPFILLLVFLAVASFTCFLFFLKRTLKHLDPSSIMPNRVKNALDTLTEGILLLDNKERIIHANAVITRKLGRTARELMGLKTSSMKWLDPKTNMRAEDFPWLDAISQNEVQSGVMLNLHSKSEGMRTYIINSSPVFDDKGKARGAVVTLDDATEMEQQSFQLSRMVELLQISRDKINQKNKELEILATQDPLSECLNRRAFFPLAEQGLSEAVVDGVNYACIMTDIDLFKSVNDNYGHGTGDQVIVLFAKMLKSVLREDDIICRYGGEEFCIFLPNCDIENAALISERVRSKFQLEGPRNIPEADDINLSASFGISDLTFGAHTIEELFTQADQALYRAKESGRNCVMVWENKSDSDFREQADA